MHNLNSINLLIAFCFFGLCMFAYQPMNAQTILQPGDLAIVGVNTNLSGCSPEESGSDEISFVCFKDIEPGTVIQLTDNGYERLNEGQWGNSEGFLVATRSPTASVIPAGSLIVFKLPPITANIEALLPDNEWFFDRISINALNFNSGGDQIYFMQGGIWDEGDTRIGDSRHNATYTGGNILFGFNSKSDWVPLANTTQESALHPDVVPCFHMEPTGGIINFSSYQGPATATTQLEWIARIADAGNWSTFPDCNSYQRPISQFEILPSGIGINCTTCQGCGQLDEKMVFSLPDFGGPFEVEYFNGTDTLKIEGANNQDTLFATLTTDATFYIVSVRDANGCPVFSDLGNEVQVVVLKKPIATAVDTFRACNTGGTATFNLTSLHDGIRAGGSTAVFWYEDAATTISIDNPQAYVSGPRTIFATIFDGNCESDPVPVDLAFAAEINASLMIIDSISCNGAADGQIELDVDNIGAPFNFDWNVDILDGETTGTGLTAGIYTVTVTNADGCEATFAITLTEPDALDLICSERSAAQTVGGSDGVADLQISGGTAPYQINWTGPSAGNQTANAAGIVQLNGLSAGNYDVQVTDANGCQISCVFTINDPGCDLSVSVNKTDASCPDIQNGRVELNISNGQAPVTIDWDVDSLDGLSQVVGLATGSYQVVVSDNRGCSNTVTFTINAINVSPTVALPAIDEVCQNNCYDLVVNYTGQPPFNFNYILDAGKGEVSLTATSDATVDTIQICPADFGFIEGDIRINFLSLSDLTTCPVILNEERTLRVNNTGERFLDTVLCQEDFLFINGTIYDRNNQSGIEQLPTNSSNGCDSIVNINLSFFQPAQSTIDTFLCIAETIEVNGTIYGRNRRQGTEILPNASMNGCDSLVFVNLTIDDQAATFIDTTLCEGETITVNNTLYDINNPSGIEMIPKVNSGCDSTIFVAIEYLESPEDTLLINLCPGASININGTTYDETNPSGTEFLVAENGCDSTVTININFNFIRQSRFDTTICPGEQVIVNGAVYDMNNTTGVETIDLPDNPCDSFIFVNVNILPAVEVRMSGQGDVCPGDSTNLIFRVENSNTVDVTVVSSDGDTLLIPGISDGSTFRISPATTTTYTLISIANFDNSGSICSPLLTGVVTVEVKPLEVEGVALDLFGGFNASCSNSEDGVATVNFIGGSPPYNVSWSNGAVGDTVTNLGQGLYQVIVVDDNGCEAQDSFNIIAPDSISLQFREIDPSCPGDMNGAIVIEDIVGGTGPYDYSLDGQNFRSFSQQGSFIINNLGPGIYTVTIQDVNDCFAVNLISIDEPEPLSVELGADQTIKFGDSLQLMPQVSFLPNRFSWTPLGAVSDSSSLQPIVTPEQTTTYVLTVFDSLDCQVSDRITITIDNSRDVFGPTAFSPNGDGINDSFYLFAGANVRNINRLQVYDRWGNLVYEGRNLTGEDPDRGWNGNFNGELAENGVYVYFAEIEFLDGIVDIIQGEVVLIR